MKIRSENTEVNSQFAELLSKRNDQRIGQMIYNALRGKQLDVALFNIEDEALIQLIVEMLR